MSCHLVSHGNPFKRLSHAAMAPLSRFEALLPLLCFLPSKIRFLMGAILNGSNVISVA